MRSLSTLLVSVLLAGAPALRAQVILSEIQFEDQWIEILNNGPNEVDMSSWSVYLATKTPNRTNNYWFGFPANSRMAGYQFLKLYWGKKIPTTTPPNELYTGDSNWHFLFGHGFEPLDRQQGALAICNTQLNAQMNSPGIFVDWIQWGGTGFKREDIAANQNLWQANSYVASVPTGASLSLLYFMDANPPPIAAYFFDFTPTPLIHNATPLGVENLGGNCSVNKDPSINLVNVGWPIHGNKDFSLVVENTQGAAFFERMIFLFSLEDKTAAWGNCMVNALGPNTLVTPQFGTLPGRTTVPVPIVDSSLIAKQVWAQALVFTPTLYYSFSNRVKLTISN
ncbi:MAG: hypothetical protein KDC87_19545 [Planctomycetes bacterium]|nr:hypothetical protein [Planctomycetota bacterium]MCB9869011.1 hypothetical protein [Planctomycetota bacterium]MCB9887971.1 hypothetical protein [Planctomycetota bacterium]